MKLPERISGRSKKENSNALAAYFTQRARQALRDGVQAIASKYTLPPNWLNYLTQLLIYDKILMPRGKLWKRYGPLHVYAPPKEFVFALKLLAGRDQDLADCRVLLPQTRIRTRQQAQRVLDRYLLPEAHRRRPKPSRPHSTCCSAQKVRGNHDAENASNHGVGVPTDLCRGRPLDGSGEF
jgi:hypothetical protein